MKRNRLLFVGLFCLVLALPIFGFSVLANEKKDGDKKDDAEKAMSWGSLPPAAQKAFASLLKTSKPEKITQETDDGATTYEAAQKVDGRMEEAKVAENGQVLEVEETIPLTDLPPAVVDKVKSTMPKAEIKEVRRVTQYFYEVELSKGSHSKEVKLFGNGQPVENDD
jgi:hypothetical protein